MRKIFAVSCLVIFATAFLSSCKAPHKCEAYSKVTIKTAGANS